MDISQKITALIEPTLHTMGLDLVQVNFKKTGKWVLEVIIERTDGAPVAIEDCVDASHEISALLDVEDPIDRSYHLEVSSPGLDRPLLKVGDYERFKGENVKIKTFAPLEGRRKFKGVLLGIQGEIVWISEDGVDIEIVFSNIAQARLDPELDFKKH